MSTRPILTKSAAPLGCARPCSTIPSIRRSAKAAPCAPVSAPPAPSAARCGRPIPSTTASASSAAPVWKRANSAPSAGNNPFAGKRNRMPAPTLGAGAFLCPLGQGRWHWPEQGHPLQPPLQPQADFPFLRLRIITAIAQARAANTRPPTNRLAQFCTKNDNTATLNPLLKYNMGRASERK